MDVVCTKRAGFAQAVCAALWKRWERMGGLERLAEGFPILLKRTVEFWKCGLPLIFREAKEKGGMSTFPR